MNDTHSGDKMSATGEIQAKWAALRETGLDLGPPTAAEADSGNGGRVQSYANGNIYWHPDTGAHEVHGGILARYLARGGPGLDRDTGRRLFGYPVSDEIRTKDGLHPKSLFQFGLIYWAWQGCLLSGELYEHWKVLTTAGDHHSLPRMLSEIVSGYPIQDQVTASGGDVAYCERGCWWLGDASGGQVVTFKLSLPQLGRPALWDSASDPSKPLPIEIVSTTPADVLERLRVAGRSSLFEELWDGRLVLKRVVSKGATPEEIRVECRLGLVPNEEYFQPIGPLHCFLPAGVTLRDRGLYDVYFRRNDGRKDVLLAPHAVYSKSSWEDFGFAHATDIHVSRRLETVRRRFTQLKQDQAAEQFHNFNDAFRDFIRYANHLHSLNLLDLVVATGDLVDYEFEDGENTSGGGNFAFFKDLVLGKIPYPDDITRTGPVEELRVPIFTVPGNHDYRKLPYPFIVSVDVLGPNKEIDSSAAHNLTRQDAICLSPGREVPTYSSSRAREFVAPDEPIAAYHRELNDKGSYAVRLGRHRLVMLDSRWDTGVLGASGWDQLAYFFNGSEDQQNFVGSNPNQQGFTDDDLTLLDKALVEAKSDGLVIVGAHAPLLNPTGNERACYFRESLHAEVDQRQITGFLLRQGPGAFMTGTDFANYNIAQGRAYFEGWTQRKLGTVGSFFQYGDTEKLLDYGTARANNETVLRRCAGQGAGRPVDLVLFGHGHYNVEFRLRRREWDELEFFTDFYTENPSFYYRTMWLKNAEYLLSGSRASVAAIDAAKVRVTVNVEPGAPRQPIPRLVRVPGYKDYDIVGTPPFESPLSRAADPAQWWKEHRPLLLQTPGLGPLENTQRELIDEGTGLPILPDPTFNGFRLAQVRQGTIQWIRLIRLADLRQNDFIMPWEPKKTFEFPGIPVPEGRPVPLG